MSFWAGWETPWDGAGSLPAGETMAQGIARAVRRLVADASGLAPKDVHPLNDGGPRSSSFATVQIVSTEDASWTASDINDAGTGEAVHCQIYLTAMVNFYRANPATPKDGAGLHTFTLAAYDLAARLPKRLQLAAYAEERRGMGLGYIGASHARDLTGVIDAQWESRGQVDLHFSAIASETAVASVFAELGDIGIKVESPGGGVFETTIEVTP